MTRKVWLSLGLFLGGIFPLLALPDRNSKVDPTATHLHFSSIVLDTHDDTTQRLLDPSFDIAGRHDDGSIDIPRMNEGGLSAIFFSIWISGTVTGPAATGRALQQMNLVRSMVAKYPHDMVFCTTAECVRRAKKENKIAVLMGVEGGHMINDSLETLGQFASLGVRYMTLTHMMNTDWADSSTDKPAHDGLTDFGRQVVLEMNRLGVMVDISHVSDKTFYDALAVSKAPLIASHSSCRALCNAPRNMTDQMIRDLAAKGGVIQINYHVGFLDQKFRDAEAANPGLDKQIESEAKSRCGADDTCELIEVEKITRTYMETGKLPRVEWTEIVDHIDHAAKLVGTDHVGLGSDFDGAVMPFGMEDASRLPQITQALLDRGYSPADVQKILGGNTLRLMEQVETISKEMKGPS
jgi:membrane dipeptidase